MATNVKPNLLVKSKINVQLQFDLYITFYQKMENRAEKLRSVLFVSGISRKLTLRILFIFSGNIEFKQQLALLSLPKSFRKS